MLATVREVICLTESVQRHIKTTPTAVVQMYYKEGRQALWRIALSASSADDGGAQTINSLRTAMVPLRSIRRLLWLYMYGTDVFNAATPCLSVVSVPWVSELALRMAR